MPQKGGHKKLQKKNLFKKKKYLMKIKKAGMRGLKKYAHLNTPFGVVVVMVANSSSLFY